MCDPKHPGFPRKIGDAHGYKGNLSSAMGFTGAGGSSVSLEPNAIGQPWENHGKSGENPGKSWGSHGETMGKAWGNHGESIGKSSKIVM